MISFDTNLLFYAIDPVAGSKHQRAKDVLIAVDPLRTFVVLQTLGELCFSVKRKRPALLNNAYAVAEQMTHTFDVAAANKADLREAIAAQQQHNFPFWDAMLWATAHRTGCTLLLSEDFQDGRTLGGVTFRNPFNMTSSELRRLLT